MLVGGLNFGPVVLGGGSTQAQTREALTCFMPFLDLH
jgi:hypothetical protein